MNEKIRKLLAMYGADQKEIDNFMYDLEHMEDAPSDEFDPDDQGDYDVEN